MIDTTNYFYNLAARPPSLKLVNHTSSSLNITAGDEFTIQLKASHNLTDVEEFSIQSTEKLPRNARIEKVDMAGSHIITRFVWTPTSSTDHAPKYNIRYPY